MMDSNDPLSLNLYIYCNNNPIRFFDPSGRKPVSRGPTQKTWAAYLNEYGVYVPKDISLMVHFATLMGKLDLFYAFSLGATKDSSGIYHISQNSWQKFVGYDNFYDNVFNAVTSMMPAKFEFKSGGTDFMIWAWKGNYLNLGAGAELGIYYHKVDSIINSLWEWECGTQYKLPMTLRLLDKYDNEIFYWDPGVNNWWITGFCPAMGGVEASYLTARYRLDFSGNKDMFKDFYDTWYGKDSRWSFDTYQYIATFTF